MTKRIVDMINEKNYVELKPLLESMVAKKVVQKIEDKKAEIKEAIKSKKLKV